MNKNVMPDYDGNVAVTVKCFEARPGTSEREMPEMTRRYTWPTHYPQLLNISKPETILSAEYGAETWAEYAKMMTWITQELASWLPLYARAEVWLSIETDACEDCSDGAFLAYQTMGVDHDGD